MVAWKALTGIYGVHAPVVRSLIFIKVFVVVGLNLDKGSVRALTVRII